MKSLGFRKRADGSRYALYPCGVKGCRRHSRGWVPIGRKGDWHTWLPLCVKHEAALEDYIALRFKAVEELKKDFGIVSLAPHIHEMR